MILSGFMQSSIPSIQFMSITQRLRLTSFAYLFILCLCQLLIDVKVLKDAVVKVVTPSDR